VKHYDIAFIGNYTKDTIQDGAGTRIVDGGAFNYGANVASRLGYRTAAVTRLSREDLKVVEALEALGVDVFPEITPSSTRLRLEYPGANPDERRIYVEATAGSFTTTQVAGIEAAAAVIGASFRGEVGLDVVRCLKQKGSRIALDVQGFVRIVRDGCLIADTWPEEKDILACLQMLKADAVEAEIITGSGDLHTAARMLHELGPEEVVLTHRDGILVYDGKRCYEASFYPEKVVGRSGRGDTCIAAYACRRLDLDPAEAVIWAAAVTSLKMESNLPFHRSREDVERLIRDKYTPDNG
jgi:sugar/nucleoside kinase (ribokinase family)